MKIKIKEEKEFMEKFIEYSNICREFEKNIDREITCQYQKYLEVRAQYENILKKRELEGLDEIMKDFISLQVVLKYPRPRANMDEIDHMYYYKHRTLGLHPAFQKMQTKTGENMSIYLRSKEFDELMQNQEVCYEPWQAMIEYCKNNFNW